MIKVNLLPAEAGKRAAGPAAKMKLPTGGVMPWLLGLLALFAVTIYAGYRVYEIGQESKRRIAQLEENKRKKQAEVTEREAEFERQYASMQEIEAKYQVVQALSPDNRIFWSEKLNMIAKSRIDLAVFVTKITLDEDITEIETEESIRQREEWQKQKADKKKTVGPEPKPIKRPVINQTLTIQAIAYGNDSPQRLRQVHAFQDVLRTLEWERKNGEIVRFMDGLHPEFYFTPQKLDQVGGVDVLRFGLVARAEPQLQQTVTPEATPPVGGAAATPSQGGTAK